LEKITKLLYLNIKGISPTVEYFYLFLIDQHHSYPFKKVSQIVATYQKEEFHRILMLCVLEIKDLV